MHELQRRVVTDLWERIYLISREEFPELGMKAPGIKRTASDWVVWKAGLPPHVSLDWKIRSACVDLSFLKGCPETPTGLHLARNLAGTRLVRTTSTIALRTTLAALEKPWTDISDAQIREALRAADCLLCFYRGVLSAMSPPALRRSAYAREPALGKPAISDRRIPLG